MTSPTTLCTSRWRRRSQCLLAAAVKPCPLQLTGRRSCVASSRFSSTCNQAAIVAAFMTVV